VDSRPRGARVLVDGKPVGVTPLRLPDVSIGSHVVRLELAGHRTWTSSTRVAAGQESRVTGSLEQIR
jgi:PEGA domain